MDIVINGVPHKIQSGEITDDKITCAVLEFNDERYGQSFYVARYSDPYCGKKSTLILDALNTEPYATQIKEFIQPAAEGQ